MIPERHRNDTPVIAVSPDPLADIQKLIPRVTDRTGRQFLVTLLSDDKMQAIDRYGLRNAEAAKQGDNLPYPTTYVLDKSGQVRWRFTEKNQAVRPTNQMIIAELNKLW